MKKQTPWRPKGKLRMLAGGRHCGTSYRATCVPGIGERQAFTTVVRTPGSSPAPETV